MNKTWCCNFVNYRACNYRTKLQGAPCNNKACYTFLKMLKLSEKLVTPASIYKNEAACPKAMLQCVLGQLIIRALDFLWVRFRETWDGLVYIHKFEYLITSHSSSSRESYFTSLSFSYLHSRFRVFRASGKQARLCRTSWPAIHP